MYPTLRNRLLLDNFCDSGITLTSYQTDRAMKTPAVHEKIIQPLQSTQSYVKFVDGEGILLSQLRRCPLEQKCRMLDQLDWRSQILPTHLPI